MRYAEWIENLRVLTEVGKFEAEEEIEWEAKK